jgi:hypothetical protein
MVCSRRHIYIHTHTGADTNFVRPQAYTIVGALFKKKNTKLGIQNEVRKYLLKTRKEITTNYKLREI